MANTLIQYKSKKQFNEKNVYLDRLAKANPVNFEEVLGMTDDLLAIVLESPSGTEWLDKAYSHRDFENAKIFAKRLLLRGDSIEEVMEITQLPYETVVELM